MIAVLVNIPYPPTTGNPYANFVLLVRHILILETGCMMAVNASEPPACGLVYTQARAGDPHADSYQSLTTRRPSYTVMDAPQTP